MEATCRTTKRVFCQTLWNTWKSCLIYTFLKKYFIQKLGLEFWRTCWGTGACSYSARYDAWWAWREHKSQDLSDEQQKPQLQWGLQTVQTTTRPLTSQRHRWCPEWQETPAESLGPESCEARCPIHRSGPHSQNHCQMETTRKETLEEEGKNKMHSLKCVLSN